MMLCAGFVNATLAADPPSKDGDAVSFYRDVRPILQAKCQGCHQPAKAGGSYVLTSVAAMTLAGESDSIGVVPGKPADSYLIEQITPDDDGAAPMPLEAEPLGPVEIELITRWIAEGATDDSPPSANRHFDADHPPAYTRPPVITSVDISPDGSLIAVAGFHEILLHELSGGDDSAPVARLIGMSERIASIKFSPDGTRLAATGGSPARLGEVQIWDVASRSLQLSRQVTYDTVYGASWSPDGKLLAFGCADNTVRAIDAETGEQVLFQGAHSDWVLDTVFSADGTHLASVGRDATAKLIEVETERFVDNITSITPGALRGGINAVTRHPARDEILFGGADGVPKIYRMHRITKRVIGDDANQLWELPPLPGRVFSVDYNADGSLIAAGSSLDGHGAVHIYAMEAAPEFPEAINKILVKPTHSRSAAEVKQLQDFFTAGVQEVAKLSFEDGGIYTVAVNHEGTRVAAAGASGMVRILDAKSGEVLREFVPVALTERQALAAADAAPARSIAVDDEAFADEALPDAAEVASLSIEPAAVQLVGPSAYVQVVASARLASGDVVDVTRLANFEFESPVAAASPSGLVRPLVDGATTLKVTLGGKSAQASVAASDVAASEQPDFVVDVSPILARAGCNAGTCHGAQAGKNGFKLSLRGYDPLFDVRALADDLNSRRIDLASPAQSLMLLKSTGSVPHEGGQVVKPSGQYYQTLLAWIENGATLDPASPRVAKVEVTPVNPIVQTVGSRQQMRVVATYNDGRTRDVTREAFVESGDAEIAKPVAGQAGLIEVLRRGEAPVLVRFEGAYAATTVTVMGDRGGFVWEQPPANNEIDRFVHAKLQRTKTAPSPLCDDYTFIRRVYLDLIGLPPTPEQIAAFEQDRRDSQWKRSRLIDQLIGSDEYVEHWSNKWADLLQVNSKFLGREGAEALRGWIRNEIGENRPYDEFARSVLTASGSTKENPAASYYKILRDPELTMENTTHLFLATRFNCNKCHDHPFERWTQDQYYQMTAFFARVGLKKDPTSGDKMIRGTAVVSATPLYEVVYSKDDGEAVHQRTGDVVAPEFPFDCEHDCGGDAERRERLAAWMTSPDNPYFAKSYANRIWAYLTGRGLIEPIDDIRAGNPPTNPELLDWLTQQFIESGFDVQRLMRTICNSRTYQLSLETNEFNEDDSLNYSHAKARRLPAEVLYDAIYHTTGAESAFPGVAKGTRAAALPDVGIRLPDGFLNNLGRPARESSCECERSNELQMGPIMALINGATVGDAVSDPENEVTKLAASEPDDRQMVQKLFLRLLARPAAEDEVTDALDVINSIDEQHDAVAKTLRDYEAHLAPIVEKRQQERAAALAAAKQELADHVAAAAPERERLARDREERIAQASQELETVRTTLVEKLPAWEVAQRSQTVWEALNPIELTSTAGARLKVRADRSVRVDGADRAKTENSVFAPADLTGVTGVRIDALSDEDLPHQGPGRSGDGNFVLSEFEVLASPQFVDPAPLVKAWDFAGTADGWKAGNETRLTTHEGRIVLEQDDKHVQIVADAAAPSDPLVLEITAKLESETELRVRWQTSDDSDFDDTRSLEQRVTPGSENWRTYRVAFRPQAPLTRLKIAFRNGGKTVAVDSVRIVKRGPAVYSPVKLQNAQADFSQDNFPAASAIDGKRDGNETGWAIAPQAGRDHVAIFETAEEYAVAGPGLLQAKLIHNYSSGQHSLGRFRVSVTRSPRPINFGLPKHFADLIAIHPDERTDEQSAELVNYYLTQDESYRAQVSKVAAAEKPVPPDDVAEEIKRRIAQLEKPLPTDPQLVRLRRAFKLSKQQLSQKRLTAAQDVAWALINSPEFLYNH